MPEIVWYGKDCWEESFYGKEPSIRTIDRLEEEDSREYEGSVLISIPYESKRMDPHISLGHEIGHSELGHMKTPSFSKEEDTSRELDVVEWHIERLMSGGEWTPRAKKQITKGLATYTGKEGARTLVSEIEGIVRRRLRGG